jgi:hypothetical protein
MTPTKSQLTLVSLLQHIGWSMLFVHVGRPPLDNEIEATEPCCIANGITVRGKSDGANEWLCKMPAMKVYTS